MIPNNEQKHAETNRRFKDTAALTAVLKRAARDAIKGHARSGHKIVVWKDNQIVWEDANDETESN